MGIDPVSVAYSYNSFLVVTGTQQLTATLSWFGGPTRDLDFTLLDSDSNAVGGSASASNPEVIHLGALPAGTYIYRVTAFTNPDTAQYTITTQICHSNTVGVDDSSPALDFVLAAAAPNPFRSETAIRFSLAQSGRAVGFRLFLPPTNIEAGSSLATIARASGGATHG